MSATLPASFADLEHWAQRFGGATFNARYASRLRADQPTLEAFYAALAPRMEAIAAHLDGHPVDALPPPERRLLELALAFMDVAPAVELYRQPQVPDGFDARRAELIEHVRPGTVARDG